MNLKKRIGAFSKLGEILRVYFDKNKSKNNSFVNKWQPEIEKQIAEQHFYNAWFTPENVEFALKSRLIITPPLYFQSKIGKHV